MCKVWYKVLLVLIIGAANCYAGQPKPIKIELPEVLYQKGLQNLGNKNRSNKTIDIFKNLMISYPFSEYTLKAQLITAYVQYNQKHYIEAETTLQNYINNYPSSPYAAYANYMLAVAQFHNAAINDTDYSLVEDAKASLEYLCKKYQNTQYAADAQNRLHAIDNLMAQKIAEIGIFYFKKQNYQATANRMEDIIKKYPQSAFYPEALYYGALSHRYLGNSSRFEELKTLLHAKNNVWHNKLIEYQARHAIPAPKTSDTQHS